MSKPQPQPQPQPQPLPLPLPLPTPTEELSIPEQSLKAPKKETSSRPARRRSLDGISKKSFPFKIGDVVEARFQRYSIY